VISQISGVAECSDVNKAYPTPFCNVALAGEMFPCDESNSTTTLFTGTTFPESSTTSILILVLSLLVASISSSNGVSLISHCSVTGSTGPIGV